MNIRKYINNTLADPCDVCPTLGLHLCHCERDGEGKRVRVTKGLQVITPQNLYARVTLPRFDTGFGFSWVNSPGFYNIPDEIELDKLVEHLSLKGYIVIETSL